MRKPVFRVNDLVRLLFNKPLSLSVIEPRREKTSLGGGGGFRPGPTNRAVQPHKTARCLEILDIGSRGIVLSVYLGVAKTKALISCAVTAQLICIFVFA